jgi:hypothetical protein
MKMLFFIFFIFTISVTAAYAGNITPYGTSCPSCEEYGYCKKPLTYHEAVNALESYYEKRGFNVIVIKHDGRFIKADIYKNNDIKDRILLDSKTGRIRSIY